VLIIFRGEVWRRKSSTFWGSFIRIVGTIFHVAVGGITGRDVADYVVLIADRVVGGIGNGMVTSSQYPCISQVGNIRAILHSYSNLVV
jgi:hypothetical protein